LYDRNGYPDIDIDIDIIDPDYCTDHDYDYLLERAIADARQIQVPESVRVLQVGTKIIIL
jgi:hypothetical protein